MGAGIENYICSGNMWYSVDYWYIINYITYDWWEVT